MVINGGLFVATNSSGDAISVQANNSDAVGVLTGAGTYANGAKVTLSAYAKKGYQLCYWLKDGEMFENNTTNIISITVNGGCTYTAVFVEVGEKVNGVAVDTVCVDDANLVECGEITMSSFIKSNVTYIVVSVTPQKGYKFVGWAIDGAVSTKYTEDTVGFDISDVKDKLITARFALIDSSNINDELDNR